MTTSDVAARAGWDDHPPRMGFFTDTSICIGCKACEVACKEWNSVPDDGFNCWVCLTTTPAGLARARGATLPSSSRASRSGTRTAASKRRRPTVATPCDG